MVAWPLLAMNPLLSLPLARSKLEEPLGLAFTPTSFLSSLTVICSSQPPHTWAQHTHLPKQATPVSNKTILFFLKQNKQTNKSPRECVLLCPFYRYRNWDQQGEERSQVRWDSCRGISGKRLRYFLQQFASMAPMLHMHLGPRDILLPAKVAWIGAQALILIHLTSSTIQPPVFLNLNPVLATSTLLCFTEFITAWL